MPHAPLFVPRSGVSLFTREWIEIRSTSGSPATDVKVSLFTREWIEISKRTPLNVMPCTVSLFTREWIEIMAS